MVVVDTDAMSNNEWNPGPIDGNGPHDATVVVPRMAEVPRSSQPPPPSAHQRVPAVPGPRPPAGGYGYAPGYANPQFGAPTTAVRYRAPGGSITMIVGALLAIIGTFLPWITSSGGRSSESINGYETYLVGDALDATLWENPGAYVAGAMVLVIAMAIVILAAGRSTATWILGIIAAAMAGLMTIGALGAVASMLDVAIFGGLTMGVGILICLLGAVVAAVGSVIVAAKSA